METKAVAIDLDGTITGRDRRIHLGAIQAIRKAEKRDISVVLATGNVTCFVEAVAVLVGTTGPLIAENGGVIVDQESGKEIVTGNYQIAKKGYEALKKRFPDIQLVRRARYRRTEIVIKRTVPVEKVREALKNHPLKVYDTKFAYHIRDNLTNKGTALQKIAKTLDIKPAEIVAIGDSENDIEMLEVAGYGIAVANADPKLKTVADYITSGAYGAGVVEAIDRVLAGEI